MYVHVPHHNLVIACYRYTQLSNWLVHHQIRSPPSFQCSSWLWSHALSVMQADMTSTELYRLQHTYNLIGTTRFRCQKSTAFLVRCFQALSSPSCHWGKPGTKVRYVFIQRLYARGCLHWGIDGCRISFNRFVAAGVITLRIRTGTPTWRLFCIFAFLEIVASMAILANAIMH